MKYRLLLIVLCLCPVFAQQSGGFKISSPPLGYPDYNEFNSRKNRINLSWMIINNEILDMKGPAVEYHRRLAEGEWGALSMRIAGFYSSGTEYDAEYEWDDDVQDWVSLGHDDMTVWGVEFSPRFEWQVINKSYDNGWGTRFIPFISLDALYQQFDQGVNDNPYSSVLSGSTAGVQFHVHSPSGIIISPFTQFTYLHIFMIDDGIDHLDYFSFNIGFDLMFSGISLSGIIQPVMDNNIITVSAGFSF